MKTICSLFLLVFLLSCQQEPAKDQAVPPPPTTPEVEIPTLPENIDASDRTYVPGQRIGLITASTTLEELKELYGAENVRKDSISIGKGNWVPRYQLFKGTTSEISVLFPDADTGVKDLQVTIDLPGTDWKSAQNGIAIGTTLEELENYNGHAFTFYGFDWQYGGAVTDWQGGALQEHRLRLAYNYADRENITLHKTVRGQQKVVSGNPYIGDLGIRVIQIIVRLPKSE